MCKRNILLLYTNFHIGGAQRHIIDLAKGLMKKNMNVIVGSGGGLLVDELNENEIRHEVLVKHSMNPILILKSIIKIIRCIKNNKIDLVHSHHRFTNLLTFITGKLMVSPPEFVSTAHNVFPNYHKFGFWLNKTICCSSLTQKYITRVSKSRTMVIHNSISENNLRKKSKIIKEKIGIASDQVVLINVGRICKQKAQNNIIEIVKFIEDGRLDINSKYVFVIVGDGPERKALDILIKTNKLDDKIKLIGERSDVSDLLNMSDIFVLTSKWEGLPLTILEAASRGLPIVSTDIGAVSDFIVNNQNGFLIDYNSKEDYAKKVIELINNKKMRTDIGHKARSTFSSKFSMDKFITKTIDFYNM